MSRRMMLKEQICEVVVTQTANQTLTITYEGRTYTSTFKAKINSTFTANITPNEHYNAGSVVCSGKYSASGSTYKVMGDMSVTCSSATIQTFTVAINQSANQTIYVSCNGNTYTSNFTCAYGSTYTAWVTPAGGYNAGSISSSSGTVTGSITIWVSGASVAVPTGSATFSTYQSPHQLVVPSNVNRLQWIQRNDGVNGGGGTGYINVAQNTTHTIRVEIQFISLELHRFNVLMMFDSMILVNSTFPSTAYDTITFYWAPSINL